MIRLNPSSNRGVFNKEVIMTSKVTIEAVCAKDKEVKVVVLDDGIIDSVDHLRNGDIEVYFIDGMKEMFIKEPDLEN